MEENKSLYYKFGTRVIVEPYYVESKITTDWKKLFIEPIKWLFENYDRDFSTTLYELQDITIKNNGDSFRIYKGYFGLIKVFLDKKLIENPLWFNENFIKKFFNSDEEFCKFYFFIKAMSLMPDNKLDDRYIVFKLE